MYTKMQGQIDKVPRKYDEKALIDIVNNLTSEVTGLKESLSILENKIAIKLENLEKTTLGKSRYSS